jgi:hypothetical protein
MGFHSLKEKINDALQQDQNDEPTVLYLLVEMRKYIERGTKTHLLESGVVSLDPKEFTTIKFFRDWAVHTEKDENKKLPDELLQALSSELMVKENGNQPFSMLENEMKSFTKLVGIQFWKDGSPQIQCFEMSLRRILSEQPVALDIGNTKITLKIDQERLIFF